MQVSLANHSQSKSKDMSMSESPPSPSDDQHAASSSATTRTNDKHKGEAFALSNLIRQDLVFMKEAFAEVTKYVENVNLQINQACDKFEKLQTSGSNEAELQQLKKSLATMKSRIPSQLKIHPVDSNIHRNPWPDVNKASDEMMDNNLYKEKKSEHTIDPQRVLEAFLDLPQRLKQCLMCFFWFPPKAIIKKSVMFYLWMAVLYVPMKTETCDEIFVELIGGGFIQSIYCNCSLMPDCCRLGLSIRSALTTEEANWNKFLPNSTPNRFSIGYRSWYSWLINVSETIIDGGSEQFEIAQDTKIVYLGRWQSSSTHHIEVADTKILYWLKNMNYLRFLSLQGISLITKLPPFISDLTDLVILDLRACHNLEMIPDGIGLLTNLTHLDMSECYFLGHMPKSLANLHNLEVLKGFFIGNSNDKQSCTLEDLSQLRLRKLNIYTSVKDFPTKLHLRALQRFIALEKLSISWGRCSSLGENDPGEQGKDDAIQSRGFLKRVFTIQMGEPFATLPPTLQKLDLQCFRGTSPPSWLRPADLKQLIKLYIKGGQLC